MPGPWDSIQPGWVLFAGVFYKNHLVSGDTPVRLFSPGQVQISRDQAIVAQAVSTQGSQAHHSVPTGSPARVQASWSVPLRDSRGQWKRELTSTARTPPARVTAALKEPSPRLPIPSFTVTISP